MNDRAKELAELEKEYRELGEREWHGIHIIRCIGVK